MCEPECPNKAISYNGQTYVIDPKLCTECVGYYDKPTCVEVCPIDCITKDQNNIETKDELLIKFKNLV